LVLQASTHVHKTHNLELMSLLSKSICRALRNVLVLRNVILYSLPVASVCNFISQTYILTANLKFPNMSTYKIQFTLIKSPKFTSNS